jgi:hypothetical protein
MKLEFSRQIFGKKKTGPQEQYYAKNCPVGAELLHVDRKTYGETDYFRNPVKGASKQKKNSGKKAKIIKLKEIQIKQ